ncbi:hypothetical protein CK230_03935 [Mesorhizobium sp. WSM3859]|nr:hypothetical protein CK230_03935 [Mesorhizobium sp. WSM3859]
MRSGIPLEGEMSPKATEGVAAHEAPWRAMKSAIYVRRPLLACRPSPPRGGRSDVAQAFANCQPCRSDAAPELPISPLEGEMSPKATEGVAARGAPTPWVASYEVGDLRETTPSGLPAISPSRGEIPRSAALPNCLRYSRRRPTSPLWGGRTEGPGGGRRRPREAGGTAPPPRSALRIDPPHKGEGKDHPAMASGAALLLGIWMSISSVDMVAPRSIETWR